MAFNFFGLFEKKDYSLSNPMLSDIFGNAPTSSGVAVNTTSALSVPAVNLAVRVISEAVASLPLHLYARNGDVKTRDIENPIYRLVHDEVNQWTSSYDFRLQMQSDVLLHGNAYAFANRVGGTVRELIRLTPSSVTASAGSGGEPVYKVKNITGGDRTYSYEDILHLKGMSVDGLCGLSPIHFAREAIGLALSLERTHAALHANGAQPGGVLSVKGKLDQPARDRLRGAWQAFQGGTSNRYKTAVLDVDAEWTPLAMTGVDSQHLETRRFQIEEVSRAFKIPPHMLYEMGRATWSNGETMGQLFLDATLIPWLQLWQGALTRVLLTPDDRKTRFIEFDANALTKADTQVRTAAYKAAVGSAWMTANEVRALDNRPPLAGGDVLNPPVGRAPADAQPSTKAYNADQPRAANGQFGSGSGSSNRFPGGGGAGSPRSELIRAGLSVSLSALSGAIKGGATGAALGGAVALFVETGAATIVGSTIIDLFGPHVLPDWAHQMLVSHHEASKKSAESDLFDSLSPADQNRFCHDVLAALDDDQIKQLADSLTASAAANDNTQPTKVQKAA